MNQNSDDLQLSELRALIVLACPPIQTVTWHEIKACQRIVEMPREWLLRHIEPVGRSALNLSDNRRYGHFLNVLELTHAFAAIDRLVQEGLASSEADVRKTAERWRDHASEDATLRELLVASCHSSAQAEEYFRARLADGELLKKLVSIARDAMDRGGDAPMQAAYWISQYPPELLMPYEDRLLEMLPLVNGYGGSIALALGKTRSARGRAAIVRELGDGKRFDAWLFRKGLEEADRAS